MRHRALHDRALTAPEDHAGQVYRPTGPRLLAPEQIAETIAGALGRGVRYVDIPDTMFLKALESEKRSRFMQTQLRYYVEEYRRHTFAVGAPTDRPIFGPSRVAYLRSLPSNPYRAHSLRA